MLTTLTAATQAGVYNAAEKCPFKIKPDGTAEELPWSGVNSFPLHYAHAGDLTDARPRKGGNRDRDVVLQRLQTPLANPTPAEAASRAADLIGVRKLDEALNVLGPFSRSREYRSTANLAHCYALRGNWAEARSMHESLLEDTTMPDDLAGTTPEQRAWLLRVEKNYYSRWLKLHEEEARKRVPPQQEKVLALFEKEQPADAIAVVQQLLLWMPEDNRLYWLLAELYAKSGQLRPAERILKSLDSFDRNYGNRPLMRQRLAEVSAAVAKLPPEKDADLPPDPVEPTDDRPWYSRLGLDTTQSIVTVAGFAVVAVLLLAFQFRKTIRRVAATPRR